MRDCAKATILTIIFRLLFDLHRPLAYAPLWNALEELWQSSRIRYRRVNGVCHQYIKLFDIAVIATTSSWRTRRPFIVMIQPLSLGVSRISSTSHSIRTASPALTGRNIFTDASYFDFPSVKSPIRRQIPPKMYVSHWQSLRRIQRLRCHRDEVGSYLQQASRILLSNRW